jgi:hypothetical protein
MSEPLKITIEAGHLKSWLKEAESGLYPLIQYKAGEDRTMLEAAYEKRGDCLRYLLAQIHAFLPRS